VVEGRTGWLSESTEAAHLASALERAWSARGSWPRCGAEARARVAAGYDLDGTLPPIIDALRHDARRAGIAPAPERRREDVEASDGRRDERVEEPALP
jgi:hypothetical protein